MFSGCQWVNFDSNDLSGNKLGALSTRQGNIFPLRWAKYGGKIIQIFGKSTPKMPPFRHRPGWPNRDPHSTFSSGIHAPAKRATWLGGHLRYPPRTGNPATGWPRSEDCGVKMPARIWGCKLSPASTANAPRTRSGIRKRSPGGHVVGPRPGQSAGWRHGRREGLPRRG